jgi:multicomponent Na+:H+ antiporter subunit F
MVWIWFLLGFSVVYTAMMFKGPTIWDRLLSLSLISTKLLLIVVLFASFHNLPYLLDVAIVCVLLGFIGIVFIALFLRSHKKGGKK